ncbi:hypothetical protein HanPSC8_Chr14g0595081 [Helianthus annuus]|nr:hypothetical protein HanPSC8_Chr14g0595081 [Helianthus annuus]
MAYVGSFHLHHRDLHAFLNKKKNKKTFESKYAKRSLRVISVLGEKAPMPCLDSVEERVELKTAVLNQLAYDMLHLVADGLLELSVFLEKKLPCHVLIR